LLLPNASYAISRRLREPPAWSVSAALAIATAQILVAIDTQRLVAAGLPFVLLACAWELDDVKSSRRIAIAAAAVAAQLPWLLAYARIWTPPLRPVEVVLAVVTVMGALYAWRPGSGVSAA
jgi:hypothetical protein